MTTALVGFLGVVVGLAVGFGYRFWSTRRDELMAATIAATLVRDAARAAERDPEPAHRLVACWETQGVALIRLISPTDYELLARSLDSGLPYDPRAAAVLDRLVRLFWNEHQAFILTPLVKYIRRDNLSDKASVIVSELH